MKQSVPPRLAPYLLYIHLQAMHVNNACMFYAPYASIVVWKLQNGTKTLVKLGAGHKLTCFDQLRKGCVFFFDNYWSSSPYLQHSIHKKNNFNEIILFQNSPVQPLSLASQSSSPKQVTTDYVETPCHCRAIRGQPTAPMHHLLHRCCQCPHTIKWWQTMLRRLPIVAWSGGNRQHRGAIALAATVDIIAQSIGDQRRQDAGILTTLAVRGGGGRDGESFNRENEKRTKGGSQLLEVLLPTSVSTCVLTLVGKRISIKSVERRFESPPLVTPSLRSWGFYLLTMLTSHYKVSPLGYDKVNKHGSRHTNACQGTFVLHFC